MAFRVNDFITSMGNPAKTSHFEMTVVSPPGLTSSFVINGEQEPQLNLRIDSAELPGRSIMTQEHKHYGPIARIPYGVIFQDTTVSMYVSEDYSEVRYFQRWQDLIVGDHRVSNFRDASAFNTRYFDEFKSTVIITAFDDKGGVRRQVELQDAYPLFVSPINMNWNNDEVVKLNVTFHYRFYRDLLEIPAPGRVEIL